MLRAQRKEWGASVLCALVLSACSDDASSAAEEGTGGFFYAGTGGNVATGGFAGSSAGGAGPVTASGGYVTGAGGIIGAGGIVVSAGGVIGAGGVVPSAGGAVQSTGGTIGGGGIPVSTGGTIGMGGDTSTGGTVGDGGSVSTGGVAGTGGAPPAVKFAGNITTRGQVRSDFITYWDQITPENEGKWGSVEGTRDRMNWGGLDAAYNYAKQHGIPFKEHTFVWGAQQPNWIGGLSQSEQRAEVEEWIRLFCERYPDTRMIDVVNEPPPHTTPPYTAALGGAGASGYDWIVQAFNWAHQYCPNAILILNDYNTIEYGNDNNHIIDIVKRIQAAGAPIDAVGAQAHAAFNVSTNTVKSNIDKIVSQTGLPVYITEYDIDVADDNRQKNIMEEQFTMFWTHPNIKGVTLWGYVSGSTWLTNSGLMSSTGQMRPAMTWLMGYLNR